MVDTKTGRTVLSFEELKVLRERKLTQEEADFSEEHLSIVWWFLNEKNYRPTTGLMLLSYDIF